MSHLSAADRLNTVRVSLLLDSIAERLTESIEAEQAQPAQIRPLTADVLEAVDTIITELWPQQFELMAKTWQPSAAMQALVTLDNWRNGTGQSVADLLGEVIRGEHAECSPSDGSNALADCSGRVF